MRQLIKLVIFVGTLVGSSGSFAQIGAVNSCPETEAKAIECISKPVWKGELMDSCSENEQKHFKCMNERRETLGKTDEGKKKIAEQEISFNEKRIEAHKIAQKACAGGQEKCSPEKIRAIDNWLKRLPVENKKLREFVKSK